MNRKVFAYGGFFLILDQVAKILIETFIRPNQVIPVIKGFFSITCVYNTGAAFSILEGRVWFLAMLTFVVFVMILKMSKDFVSNRRNTVAFGLLVGGIFGNLSDRLFLGSVRDFLRFNILGYNFPVFNIADMCIVIGIGLLVISMLKGEDESGSSSKIRRKSEIR